MNQWKEKLWSCALPHVRTPAQYVGGEWNIVRKDPAAVVLRFCLAFPDTYSIGMSSAGLHVLYGILNRREDVYAERAFAPWLDMQERLRATGAPLCSLETCTPLREFDVVGFSLQYEMGFTNMLDMLELGGIPLLASERTAQDPIIVAGGACASNPEPLADFVDLFIIGDGEERINDLADAAIALKRQRPQRRLDLLAELAARVPGSYAPALYEVEWRDDPSDTEPFLRTLSPQDERAGRTCGRLQSLRPRRDVQPEPPAKASAAMVADLDSAYVPDRPLLPFVEVVHDRITIEIMRGCSRGCRFCHAGMTRRPVRWRSVETIVKLCEAQYAATGHSEISLASLSSSDYPEMPRLIRELTARFAGRKVSLSLPSLRVDDQLEKLPELIGGVRKSTLTMAPEAATERLRSVINKDLSEDDLLRGAEAAYAQGWSHVKLYFMVGLPTETDEDAAAICDLATRVSQLRRKTGKGPAPVNLSVAPFVPKPHTPFQWEPMARIERIEQLRALLRSRLRSRAVRLAFHRPDRSFLEGVFARGDRRLGKVLLEAHRRGCRFDAWDETFDMLKWNEAFAAAGVGAEGYACRAREKDELLPWSHVDAGVSTEFLWRERERALRGEFTPDCRRAHCQSCGIARCANRSIADCRLPNAD